MRKIGYLILALAFFCTGCVQKSSATTISSEPKVKTAFDLLGTVIAVSIYDDIEDDGVFQAVFDRIQEIDYKMTANTLTSEVAAINAMAGKGYVKVSDETYDLIKESILFSSLSGGSFDITIGAIDKLWNIGAPEARVPAQEEIDEKLLTVGYENILYNDEEKSIMLRQEGVMIDLGAIAKGYACDESVRVLEEYGIQCAILDLGGNIYVQGLKHDGSLWSVGIRNPMVGENGYIGVASLEDMSIVTSGGYERFLEADGQIYCHILDPKTGYPADSGLISVTIFSRSSTDGDGLSTAAFVAGLEDGMAMVENFTGAEAVFITTENKVFATTGVREQFNILDDRFEWGN